MYLKKKNNIEYFGFFLYFCKKSVLMLVRLRKVMLECIVTVLIVKIASYTVEQRMIIVKLF